MNKVHATTQKLASSLNLYVSLEAGLYELPDGEELTTVCVENELDDSDARGLVTYIVNPNGTYTYHSRCTYAEVDLEDLPGTLNNERELRDLIKYVGSLIN